MVSHVAISQETLNHGVSGSMTSSPGAASADLGPEIRDQCETKEPT